MNSIISLFPPTRPLIIAGPCSAETKDQVFASAKALKEAGVTVFRAGLWKPRTRPGCFEGVGQKGISWLQEVQSEFGLKVCTEVGSAAHVKACLEAGFDMLWIGARTTANPFLMQEISEALAGTKTPVLVKNPVNADLYLWMGAIERLLRQGVENIGLIHRGYSGLSVSNYRNQPHWQHVVSLCRKYPEMPFFCDPSHIAGDVKYIAELSQKALDLGMDGLMIEVHCCPSSALSDSAQQLTPVQFSSLISSLVVPQLNSSDRAFNQSLISLREKIDDIDSSIVRLLGERMQLCREIGRAKKANKITILQNSRWDEVLNAVENLGKEFELDDDYLHSIFNLIHAASVAEQDKV